MLLGVPVHYLFKLFHFHFSAYLDPVYGILVITAGRIIERIISKGHFIAAVCKHLSERLIVISPRINN